MARLNDTKIPITEFLDAYRRQPCLYNSVMDTYKNRVVREQAYEAIIKTLKIPQLTVLDIKLKIKSVRTVYTKELRILLREKEMGRSYEPKLFWFKRADAFLRSVSLSHCKRLKDNNETLSIKKEASEQQLLFNVKAALIEDELQQSQQQQQQQQQQEDEVEDGSENEAYRSPKRVCTASHTTQVNRTMDDSSICPLEEEQQQQQQEQQQQQQQTQQQQQHQQQQQELQQQTTLRKLRYLPYTPSQQQQQQHRQSTPFPAPSPTQQPDLSSSSSASAICFGGSTATEDDLIIFGQSIASQLRSIPDPYSRSVAKLRIQQVLFEAETGQSSESVNPQLPSF